MSTTPLQIRTSSPKGLSNGKRWPPTGQVPPCTTSTPLLPYSQHHFYWIFREVRSAQQAEFIQHVPASIGIPKRSVRSASDWTTPAYAPPRVPFLQHRITTPHSVPAGGVDTPQPASICNSCSRLSPAHPQRCSLSSHNLKFQQPGPILDNHTPYHCQAYDASEVQCRGYQYKGCRVGRARHRARLDLLLRCIRPAGHMAGCVLPGGI